jgi:hypothetical protein
MSAVWPGSTSEIQIGKPPGSISAWTLPPKSQVLPEYQESICSPLTLSVQHQVGQPVGRLRTGL